MATQRVLIGGQWIAVDDETGTVAVTGDMSLRDAGGDAINPATQEMLASVLAAMTAGMIDPAHHYSGRTALTGAAQVIALGAAYRNIEIHLDAGASDIHYRLNPDGVTTAASTADALVTAADDVLDQLTDGVSYVYIYSTGATGSVTVRAW